MLHKTNWVIMFMLLLSIVGCAPAGTEPGAVPPDDAAEQVAAEALPVARQALVDYLDVSEEALELGTIADAEWSDSCLGLGGPAESCAAVITPGYAITFTVDGTSYTVRTDLDGTQARVEAAAGATAGSDALPAAVAVAQAELARELGVEPAAVDLVDFTQREWSDSCLGLGGPAEICAAAITPGWQVNLMVAGQQVEVRTDAAGDQVRIVAENAGDPAGEVPGPELNGAVVFFQRSGGLAGELLTARIYPDGTIERALGEPGPDLPVETAVVDAAVVATLLTDLEEAGYFGLERTYLPTDPCCDRFLYLISIQGDAGVQTVEALEATEATPAALWQSVALIEAAIDEAFSS